MVHSARGIRPSGHPIFFSVSKVALARSSALGFANLWLAVFADVGVCLIAILNSMRAIKVKNG